MTTEKTLTNIAKKHNIQTTNISTLGNVIECKINNKLKLSINDDNSIKLSNGRSFCHIGASAICKVKLKDFDLFNYMQFLIDLNKELPFEKTTLI